LKNKGKGKKKRSGYCATEIRSGKTIAGPTLQSKWGVVLVIWKKGGKGTRKKKEAGEGGGWEFY